MRVYAYSNCCAISLVFTTVAREKEGKLRYPIIFFTAVCFGLSSYSPDRGDGDGDGDDAEPDSNSTYTQILRVCAPFYSYGN